jgi:hypothetical protein
MNIFDGAIIVSAISGGIMGGIVAAIISLGVLRAARRASGTAATPTHTRAWRIPRGPLARHLAKAEPRPEVETRGT